MKKALTLLCSGLLLLNVYGCIALIAGAAGGAGTAVWLSGKLSQEFHASYDRTVLAAERALEELKMPVTKESKEEEVTQLRSKYSDGKEVWIDVRRVSAASTKVEVRVGAVHPDKNAADQILKTVQRYL